MEVCLHSRERSNGRSIRAERKARWMRPGGILEFRAGMKYGQAKQYSLELNCEELGHCNQLPADLPARRAAGATVATRRQDLLWIALQH